MSRRVDTIFVALGLVFVFAGMSLGAMMASSHDHGQLTTHAHLNLVGGVFSMLFGLAYRAWPALKAGRLPMLHLVLHTAGVVIMFAGLVQIYGATGQTPVTEGLATAGSVLVMIGTLIFLLLFFAKAFREPADA